MSGTKFDPSQHLRNIKGKGGNAEYLDVKWRLVWLRSEHPNASTVIEHIEISPDIAIFRATVTIPDGGSATDYGSETPKDFGDFIEKAATKALGRALAQLGYGTQFVGEELDEGVRIVDSPVDRTQTARQRAASVASLSASPSDLRPAATGAAEPPPPTDEQLLATIRNVNADADARWNALWDYYERAETVAELNTRADVAYSSGMETRDLKAAYGQNHQRLSKLFAPASIAG